MSGPDDLDDERQQYAQMADELDYADALDAGWQPPDPGQPQHTQPQHHTQEPAPEPQHHDQGGPEIPLQMEDPVGHFDARMGQMEGHAQEERFWGSVAESENQVRAEVGDCYDDACRHLESSRVGELERMLPNTQQNALLARQYGLPSVAHLRAAVLARDRIAVAQHAFQTGQSPAQVYYSLAIERGYAPKVSISKSGMRHLSQLYVDDPARFDKEWDRWAARARRVEG